MKILSAFRRTLTTALAATGMLFAKVATVDDYPSRAIKLIIPFAIGRQ